MKKIWIALSLSAFFLAGCGEGGNNETEMLTTYEQTESHTQATTEEAFCEVTTEEVTINETTSEVYSIEETQDLVEAEAKEEATTQNERYCYISVDCSSILNNRDNVSDMVLSLVPADGIILPETRVALSGGESVFDVLQGVLRENNIHLEYSETPGLNSTYIEGINNIYEFDCGELSGWLYKVNGEFVSLGCDSVKVNNSDKIEFVFSCDLGRDSGGYNEDIFE